MDTLRARIGFCNYIYMLRARSSVNPTRRRSANPCTSVEKPTEKQWRIQTHPPSKNTALSDQLSLATSRQPCPTKRAMHQTHPPKPICLHTSSTLDVCPPSKLTRDSRKANFLFNSPSDHCKQHVEPKWPEEGEDQLSPEETMRQRAAAERARRKQSQYTTVRTSLSCQKRGE